MNITTTDFFTVWEIDDDGKKATIRMSCSRKVKDNETSLIEHNIAKRGYVSTNWNFVQFVGKAYNKLKKYEIKSGDRITKLNAKIQQEPYWNNTEQMVAYPRNPQIVVFDFELPETGTQSNLDKAPAVEKEEETKPQAPKNNYPF